MEKTAGILVDYDLYRESDAVRSFVKFRYGKAALVALVTDPEVDELDDHYLWDVIIKNHKGWSEDGFKTSAMLTLKEASNIIPVIALDESNTDMYYRHDVLYVMDDQTDPQEKWING